jgi:D-xylose transport system permease protein
MLAYRGIVLGVTDGVTVAPVSPEFFLGQGYLPPASAWRWAWCCSRWPCADLAPARQPGAAQLPVAPVWRDALQAWRIIGAVLFGFVTTLNSYEGIPLPVLLLLVLLGIFSYIATQTVFGRRIYAVGSNMEATRLSGINVRAVKLWIFGLMGLMCALAGLINTARLAAGSPSAGMSGELDVIAACFIGGTSMRGGSAPCTAR